MEGERVNSYGPYTHEQYVLRCQDAAIAMRDLMFERLRCGVSMEQAEREYARNVREAMAEIEKDYVNNLLGPSFGRL